MNYQNTRHGRTSQVWPWRLVSSIHGKEAATNGWVNRGGGDEGEGEGEGEGEPAEGTDRPTSFRQESFLLFFPLFRPTSKRTAWPWDVKPNLTCFPNPDTGHDEKMAQSPSVREMFGTLVLNVGASSPSRLGSHAAAWFPISS